ncbi:MAG: hypothetical protein JNJ57_17625, partial [Saprospiraceae bacterium]|nr:hypothetical protein [Saprospiraceae bacterium]
MRITTLFIALMSSVTLLAQPKLNSPYSRFGIGDLNSQYFANAAGWGGQTAAFHDPFHLNIENPASFAFLRTTAFEAGLFSKYSNYQSRNASQGIWSGNLAYLALGFTLSSPINEVLDRKKSPWKYGMGLAITPYSLVGYDVETFDDLPDIGTVRSNFQGSGGSYRLNWSNAVRHKNTAFGVSLGWLFGKSSYESITSFTDDPTGELDTFTNIFFQDNFRDDVKMNGFVWKAGFQHDFVLQTAENDKDTPTKWITFGVSGEGKHQIKTTADQFRIRSRGQLSSGQYVDADTFLQVTDVKQHLTLPATFAIGLQYVKANKFKAGAQFGIESWSGYQNEVRPETFRNTISISGGIEYTPDYISYNRFGKRVRYRIGGYYRQDPRTVNNTNFDDIGLTMGVGLPLILPRQQTSFINAALEIGKIGTDSPIEETYFKFTLGFTLNDNTWFYKRRFE